MIYFDVTIELSSIQTPRETPRHRSARCPLRRGLCRRRELAARGREKSAGGGGEDPRGRPLPPVSGGRLIRSLPTLAFRSAAPGERWRGGPGLLAPTCGERRSGRLRVAPGPSLGGGAGRGRAGGTAGARPLLPPHNPPPRSPPRRRPSAGGSAAVSPPTGRGGRPPPPAHPPTPSGALIGWRRRSAARARGCRYKT